MPANPNIALTAVEFTPLTHEHVDAAVDCLAESFMDEPICRALALPKEALLDFLKPRIEITARDGFSCVAVENGKVVSVAFNDDNSDQPVPYANSERWDAYWVPILNLLEQLHQGSQQEQQFHAEGLKFFHMFFWATLPEARGKGYLKRLVEMSLEIAKSKGFDVAMVEATSLGSQVTCRKFEFELSHALPYQGVPKLASIGNTALELYLFRLKNGK